MGSLAMLDLVRALDLVETVQAVQLVACAQALDCRATQQGSLNGVAQRARDVHQLVRRSIAATEEDRPMDADIDSALAILRGEALLNLLS